MSSTSEKIAFLARVAGERPEYAEVLSLFRELYGAIGGREGETGITFSLPDNCRAERLRDGFPLLSADDMAVDREKAAAFVGLVIDVMARVGKDGGDGLGRLRRTMADGSLELAPLLAACLTRDRKTLDEAAASVGIQAPLLEFALEAPLRTALEQVAQAVDPALTGEWREGYCPVCGSRAGMAELAGEEGRRYLSCSACFHRWPYRRLGCPYCGNGEPEKLTYFTVDDGPDRVDVCLACSRYVKTRDSRRGNAGVPLEVEDLATIHLDLLAAREGYERGK
ncbi:formate dehydrogenase accessory protein FdhE [Geobacter sp.]|uniref:formate dehydrogenase accessory protein FdhE n=1 Tax=Geobacter sp. TaxID=46610 RepID=UPI002619E6F1|nr:formate dehydrogenase accessory protein FdhE [Geobacter sp.]